MCTAVVVVAVEKPYSTNHTDLRVQKAAEPLVSCTFVRGLVALLATQARDEGRMHVDVPRACTCWQLLPSGNNSFSPIFRKYRRSIVDCRTGRHPLHIDSLRGKYVDYV